MVVRRGLEPTAAGPPGLSKFRGAWVLCVSLRSRVAVWSISSLLSEASLRPKTQRRREPSFPPKLWFCQQPLGATVASATNDKWVRAGVGDRRSLVPTLTLSE